MDDTLQQRRMLFIFGCVPFRLLIAHAPMYVPEDFRYLQSGILLMTGLSFATLFAFKLRLNAPEGGGETWWRNVRPMHAILYLGAGLNAYLGENEYASFLLFLDVYLGVTASIIQHSL